MKKNTPHENLRECSLSRSTLTSAKRTVGHKQSVPTGQLASILEIVPSRMYSFSGNALYKLFSTFPELPKIKKRKKEISYYNVACSFDIESTSFLNDENEKTAIMYEWTFCFQGFTIYGRTWEEFKSLLSALVKHYEVNDSNRLVIYVHNLSYEFAFMNGWFEWSDVFAIDTRKVCTARTTDGIEFRCSYILSGYSLSKLSEQLQNFTIRKLVGDLDYSLMRHSKTELTRKELDYCENDVLIVVYYIYEKFLQGENITQIPPTKTSYIRRLCRKECLNKKNYFSYTKLMEELSLTTREYDLAKRVYQGGFTHANSFKVGRMLKWVGSEDETSAYPFAMVAFQYPMSEGEPVPDLTQEEFYDSLQKYCCMFDIEIINIKEKFLFENLISFSKCKICEKSEKYEVRVNNGRIAQAGRIITSMTEVDFLNFRRFYDYDCFYIRNFRRYEKGYLPTPLIKTILELYQKKTELKGVEGKEVEYLGSKEKINSAYGMCVTDINREEEFFIDHKWLSHEEKNGLMKTKKENIDFYNNSKNRFLSYLWGVWVTSYARFELTGNMILKVGEDYNYSDTDSVKYENYQNHIAEFEKDNERRIKLLKKAMLYHGLNFSMCAPKTIKGKEKILGLWDFEGVYKRFKTLGAKRYAILDTNNVFNITVSGVNKEKAVPYIIYKATKGKIVYKNHVHNKDIKKVFDYFAEDMYIPSGFTGKNCHTYLEYPQDGVLVDYNGIPYEYHEKSSVHLSESDYELGFNEVFKEFITSRIHERGAIND